MTRDDHFDAEYKLYLIILKYEVEITARGPTNPKV